MKKLIEENEEEFINNVYDFLKQIKKDKIEYKQKKKLEKIVKNMKNISDIQKRRFILYYCSKNKETLNSIALKENCSNVAIRFSVIRTRRELIKLKDDRKRLLIEIINN